MEGNVQPLKKKNNLLELMFFSKDSPLFQSVLSLFATYGVILIFYFKQPAPSGEDITWINTFHDAMGISSFTYVLLFAFQFVALDVAPEIFNKCCFLMLFDLFYIMVCVAFIPRNYVLDSILCIVAMVLVCCVPILARQIAAKLYYNGQANSHKDDDGDNSRERSERASG